MNNKKSRKCFTVVKVAFKYLTVKYKRCYGCISFYSLTMNFLFCILVLFIDYENSFYVLSLPTVRI